MQSSKYQFLSFSMTDGLMYSSVSAMSYFSKPSGGEWVVKAHITWIILLELILVVAAGTRLVK